MASNHCLPSFFMKMDAKPDLFDRVLLTSDKIWTQNKIIVVAYDRQLTKSVRRGRFVRLRTTDISKNADAEKELFNCVRLTADKIWTQN